MKILLIRLMGLGDVASILIPAVKLVRQQYPQATTDVMTYAAGVELMNLMPEVNAILEVKPEQWPNDFNEAIPHFMQIAEVVIGQQYDLVINFDTWFMPCFLARVLKDAGLKVQGNFINQSVEHLFANMYKKALTQHYFSDAGQFLASTFPHMHDWLKTWWNDKFEVKNGYPEFYLNHCCGFKHAIDISLEISADEELKQKANGKKIIALSMQGSKVSKQYPFQQTLTKYLQLQGYYVWGEFDGSVPMQTTLARLKSTDLLITVPTSTQWLAKLVGCPSLMISGPLMPKILGAEIAVNKTMKCQYCCQTTCAENLNFACMAVPPQDILFKVEDFFKDALTSFESLEAELIDLFMAKRYEEAEQIALAKLDAYPRWLNGWKILSDTYLIQGKNAEAPAFRALQLNQEDAQEHCYYGMILQKNGDLQGAAQAYEIAVKIKSDYAAAHNNLGIVKKELGDVEAGINHYRHALKLNPQYAGCMSNLLFCLSHYDKYDAKALYQEHLKFGKQFESVQQWTHHSPQSTTNRKLNIGFVSADFRDHSVTYCFEPTLQALAQSAKLNLVAYYNHSTEDAYTQRLKNHFHAWRNVVGLSDTQLSAQIQADQIDILVDLSGHTAGNRLTTFALKPAPIQVSWFGYMATTGLKTMDYYFADAYLAPPSAEGYFSEKIVRLPVNANFAAPILAPEVNALPALKNGYLTFGSFNRPSKISQSTIALWASLLKAIPDAKLLLGAMPQKGQYERIQKAFLAKGIATERLQFHPRETLREYLDLHHQVDICLDTQPSSGVTPAFFAAWMGVPTLCLEGKTVTNRGAMAVMSHLNLEKLIAKNSKEFVTLAKAWQENHAALNVLRQNMRETFNASNIAQPHLLADALEKTFQTMWQQYLKKHQPQKDYA